MKPVEPTEDGRRRTIFAQDQSEYIILPATVGPAPQIEVTSEWELSDDELDGLMRGGRIQLKLWTFGQPLQPMHLTVVSAPMEDSGEEVSG